MIYVNFFHIVRIDMSCYKLTENEEETPGYGIEAVTDDMTVRCDGVTTDKTAMIKLVALCNDSELEICHLDDILEDYLTDFCI